MQDHGVSRFCVSCKQDVVDYSKLSDHAFQRVLTKGLKQCGRFRADQLQSGIIRGFTPLAVAALLFLNLPQAAAGVPQDAILNDTLRPGHTIFGRVTNMDGQAMAGVTLQLSGSAETTTNQEGRFQLSAVPPATAIITTQMPGYLRQSRSYHPAMGATEFNFVLQSREEAWSTCIVMGTPVITEFDDVQIQFSAKQMDLSEEMKLELALLAAQLRQFPMARLSVVAFASSQVQRATARTRMNQVIAILSDKEGISADRIDAQVERYGEAGMMRMRIIQ